MDSGREVIYKEQFKRFKEGEEFRNFADKHKVYHRPAGDKHSIICEQGGTTNFSFSKGNPNAKKFLDYLNKCVQRNYLLHFTERQEYIDEDENLVTHSGIMIDLDFELNSTNKVLDRKKSKILAKKITKILAKLLDLDYILQREKILKFHIVYTKKQCVEKRASGYKDGAHILIPGIQVSKVCKKLLRSKMIEEKIIEKVFKGVDFTNNSETIIDKGSSHVPVYLFGSSKFGKERYELGEVFVVEIDSNGTVEIKDCDVLHEEINIGTKIKKRIVKKHNLVLELSLHYNGDVIKKHRYNLKPEFQQERSEEPISFEEQLNTVYGKLNTAAVNDVALNEMKQMLSILDPKRLNNYKQWHDLIAALASGGDQYYDMAVWISMQDKQKWLLGNNGVEGITELNKLWKLYCGNDSGKQLSLKSIEYWAKLDNPDKYREIKDGTMFSLYCSKILFDNNPLSQAEVAEVLATMIGKKFVFVESGVGVGVWYMFVLPDDDAPSGSLYKFMLSGQKPLMLQKYLYEKLSNIVSKDILEYIKKLSIEASDSDQQKYYDSCKKAVKGTMKRLGDTGFQNGVINQLKYRTVKYNFLEQLDKLPYVIGVKNGVIKLGERIDLIRTYHDYPISKFCVANYKPYDPEDAYIQQLESIIADIIIEPDARNYIMKYFASTLDFAPKESMIFLWYGVGGNAKSFIMELHKSMLGENYGGKLPFQFLSEQPGKSSSADPALMTLEFAHWTYFSEAKKGTIMYMPKIKELTGNETVSGRNLYEKQKQFRPRGHYTAATNNKLRIIGSDNGTWRRILFYHFKKEFKSNPDPNNPLEQKDDKGTIDNIMIDKNGYYKDAWLSIMTHHYMELKTKYGGKLNNVSKQTIDKETEQYRIMQDTLHRFIKLRIKPNKNAAEIKLERVADAYHKWYSAIINSEERKHTSDTIEDLCKSSLNKFIIRNDLGMGVRLKDHELMMEDVIGIIDEEG